VQCSHSLLASGVNSEGGCAELDRELSAAQRLTCILLHLASSSYQEGGRPYLFSVKLSIGAHSRTWLNLVLKTHPDARTLVWRILYISTSSGYTTYIMDNNLVVSLCLTSHTACQVQLLIEYELGERSLAGILGLDDKNLNQPVLAIDRSVTFQDVELLRHIANLEP
jgi:hypothetical protein